MMRMVKELGSIRFCYDVLVKDGTQIDRDKIILTLLDEPKTLSVNTEHVAYAEKLTLPVGKFYSVKSSLLDELFGFDASAKLRFEETGKVEVVVLHMTNKKKIVADPKTVSWAFEDIVEEGEEA